jgi:hypothetical protein
MSRNRPGSLSVAKYGSVAVALREGCKGHDRCEGALTGELRIYGTTLPAVDRRTILLPGNTCRQTVTVRTPEISIRENKREKAVKFIQA